jgi:hypothetical protein
VDGQIGTGNTDATGVLEELHRQKFKGVMALEYEAGSSAQKLIDDLKQSISFFDTTAQEITASKK